MTVSFVRLWSLSYHPHFFTTNGMNTKLNEVDFNIGENEQGLLIEKVQAIPQEYIDSLKEARHDTKHAKTGEYHRAASIPVIVVEKWMKEGYDVFNEPVSKTLAKLRLEGLDYFITTEKQL